jgi:KAP family P-loop domain
MPHIRGDDAICSRGEDLLGRRRFADDLTRQILDAPLGPGVVVGVVGDWGSGKTSVLNLVREAVAEDGQSVILTFDPWMFSGSDELVARFLQELGAQLAERDGPEHSPRLAKVGQALLDYGQALAPLVWVPAVGAWAGRIASAAAAVNTVSGKRHAEPSIDARRDGVCEALVELDCRVLIVVDDLDRLEPQQIRDVVRLVRLVGNFPNTTYLLAYSRGAVEAALSRDPARSREDGAAYLEKIVQAPHDLPRPQAHRILELFAQELAAVTAGIEVGPFDEARWHLMLSEGIAGFLSTLRASSRLLNVISTTLRLIGAEVNVADVIALEALRLFAPEVWDRLFTSVAALTGEADASTSDVAERRQRHSAIVAEVWGAAETRHVGEVHALLGALFPYAGALVREQAPPPFPPQGSLRVADPDVFRTYLQRQVGERRQVGSPAQRAFGLLGDGDALADMLDALEPDALEQSVGGLVEFAAQFDGELAESAIPVLLNQLSRMRERPENMFAVSPREQTRRVVLQLLRSVPHDTERSALVSRVLGDVVDLSDRLVLVELVGPRGIRGHDLVDHDEAQSLRSELAAEVLDREDAQLAGERRLYELFCIAADEDREAFEEWVPVRCEDDGVLLRLLVSVSSEALRSDTPARRHGETKSVWRLLASWLGADALSERLAELRSNTESGSVSERIEEGIVAAHAEKTRVEGESPLETLGELRPAQDQPTSR